MPRTSFTGLASGLRVAHRFLQERGLDPDQWLARQGVEPQSVRDPRARLPLDLIERIALQLVREFPGENLGAELAAHSRITDHHLIGVLCYASSNGIEAFERFSRYQVFMNTAEPFEITEDDDYLTVERRILMSPPAAALAQSLYFSIIIKDLRQVGITEPFEPVVSFTTSPQGSLESYQRALGKNIRFDQPRAFLQIPRDVLLTPLSTANSDIITMSEDMFAALVQSVRASGLQPSLRLKILDNLPDRVISEADAAMMMNMSVRTLQRRLKAEGTNFKTVQRDARAQMAKTMLSDPGLSVTEIAFHCGFSEQAAFSRAFRSWTKQSPTEFRGNL